MFTSTLLRLDLSGNLINAAAAEALGHALFGDHPTGNNTDGDENGISVSAGAAGGTVKGPPPPPLEFLDVSRNPLGDEGGAALLTAIATSPTLTGLVMAEAGLGARAATALAAALAPGPLRRPPTGVDAPLSTPGATAGARACAVASSEEVLSSQPPIIPTTIATTKNRRGLPMLKTLDVSKNDVGVGGTTEIAGALSGGGAPQLESLSIGYNNVGDEGAAALGRAVGLRLASLDLSGNALSGVGVGAVLSAPGLREAKLFHNACGDEGENTFTKNGITEGGAAGNAGRVLHRRMQRAVCVRCWVLKSLLFCSLLGAPDPCLVSDATCRFYHFFPTYPFVSRLGP